MHADDKCVYNTKVWCKHWWQLFSCCQCILGLRVESGFHLSPSNVEVFIVRNFRLTLNQNGPMLPMLLLIYCCKQAAMQAVQEEEEEVPPPLPAEAPPPPRAPAAAPVSKWTLVDYDEDNPPADLEGCAVISRSRMFISVSVLALFPASLCDVKHLL